MAKKNFTARGGLNKDVAKQYVPDGDWIDAKNITVETTSDGGLLAIKNATSFTVKAANFNSLLAGAVTVVAVSDNLGTTYVLSRNNTNALLTRINEDNTTEDLLLYAHEIDDPITFPENDFDPDLKIIGDVLVWNYYKGCVPLSWNINRANLSLPPLEDFSLIKQPPVFPIEIEINKSAEGITGITLDNNTFDESDNFPVDIGNLTFTTDIDTTLGFVYILEFATNNDSEDVSDRIELFQVGDPITSAGLRTAGAFNHSIQKDRNINVGITLSNNDLGISFSENFILEVQNTEPVISYEAAITRTLGSFDPIIPLTLGDGTTVIGDLVDAQSVVVKNVSDDSVSTEFQADIVTAQITEITPLGATASFGIYVEVTDNDGLISRSNDIVLDVLSIDKPLVTNVLVNVTQSIITGKFLLGSDPNGGGRPVEFSFSPTAPNQGSANSPFGTGAVLDDILTGEFTVLLGGHTSYDPVPNTVEFFYVANIGTPQEIASDAGILTLNLVKYDPPSQAFTDTPTYAPESNFFDWQPQIPIGYNFNAGGNYVGYFELKEETVGSWSGLALGSFSLQIIGLGAGWTSFNLGSTQPVSNVGGIIRYEFTGDAGTLTAYDPTINDLTVNVRLTVTP